MGVKITVIGAGSLVFTPNILADLTKSSALAGSEVCLMDIDEERLNLMAKLADRIVRERKSNIIVDATTDRVEALKNADYVVISISVGTDIERFDVEIPKKYGIYASVGDTTGPQGFARALRHIPVMVDIARDIEKICPNAFVLNVTNPMTALCTAMLKTSKINLIGLCVGIYIAKNFIARFLNLDSESISVIAGGINHFTWIKEVFFKGEDVYPRFHEAWENAKKSYSRLEMLEKFKGHYVSLLLYDKFGLFPSPSDSHVAEFLPYFIREDKAYGSFYGLTLYPQGTIYDLKWREQAWARLVEWATGKAPLDELFARTFTEETLVIRVLESLASKRNDFYEAVNVPNMGSISDIPSKAIVEVPGVVGNIGVKPVQVGQLPDTITELLRQQLTHIDLTVEAALTGDRKLALQALLMHPSIPTLEVAENILDDLIKYESKYLPQFKV
jgi:alpha-galactosidase